MAACLAQGETVIDNAAWEPEVSSGTRGCIKITPWLDHVQHPGLGSCGNALAFIALASSQFTSSAQCHAQVLLFVSIQHPCCYVVQVIFRTQNAILVLVTPSIPSMCWQQLCDAHATLLPYCLHPTGRVALSAALSRCRCALCAPQIEDLAGMLNAMGAKISGAGSSRVVVQGVARLSGTHHSVIPDRIEAGTCLVSGTGVFTAQH